MSSDPSTRDGNRHDLFIRQIRRFLRLSYRAFHALHLSDQPAVDPTLFRRYCIITGTHPEEIHFRRTDCDVDFEKPDPGEDLMTSSAFDAIFQWDIWPLWEERFAVAIRAGALVLGASRLKIKVKKALSEARDNL